MATFKLQAQLRDRLGKRSSNKLRKEGWVPAVLYGGGEENLHLRVLEKEVKKILAEKAQELLLEIEGKKHEALVQEVQWDTFAERILHLDFLRKPREN
ncbi:MAG: 50S ribosomal protein L25 [Planctomycetota bacterium]|nr:MAG: 50S ribosomal protein L25 [Planctomycetota bacterium]